MNKNNVIKLSPGCSSHVRLSPSECKRIKKDSKVAGKSIPELLRNAYFKNLPVKVLVNKNDLDILRKDLNRIGNNLNQIAKRLNSGLMHGWSNSLDLVLEQFKILNKKIYYGYGIPKN